MTGPEAAIELFHGYTYSGHPLACAAAMAALDIYEGDGLFARAAGLEVYFEEAVHRLDAAPGVIDVRNIGLAAGIELAPSASPGARGYQVFLDCLERGILVRQTGDIIALSPPLIISEAEIDRLVDALAKAIAASA